MKKLLTGLLVLCLVFGLVACTPSPATTATSTQTTTGTGATTSTQATTTSNLLANICVDTTYPCVYDKVAVEIAFVPSSGSTNFNVNENWMVTYFKNVTNLDITWTLIDPAGSNERISLMLSSATLPDAIQGKSFNTSDIVQYGLGEELFRPINDLLPYCPQLSALFDQDPLIRAAVTCTDGNIYGFPGLSNVYSYLLRFFINSVWLEKVGLENPKTLADLKTMLTAFRDEDANGNGNAGDEIPWSGSWSEAGSERHLIFAAYGYINQFMQNIMLDFNQSEPQIAYIATSSHYKDYLKFMNGLWQDGLLDLDMFTQAETQVQATVLNGTVGMVAMSAPYVYDPDHQDDWIAVTAMVAETGKQPVFPKANTVAQTAYFVISAETTDEKAAALANFADGYYSLETYGFATYGPEADTDLDYFGWGHYYDAEKNTILYKLHPNANGAWNHRTTYLTFWNVPGMVGNGYDPYRLAYAEKYPDSAIGQQFKNGIVSRKDEISQQQNQGPFYVNSMPSFFMSMEDLKRTNELVTPLDDYVKSMEAQFITGNISIDAEFDNFQTTLKTYGVEEFTQIYTKYYAAYKANQ